MFNRLQIRIILVLAVIFSVFIAGFYFLSKWEQRNLQKAVQDFQRQQSTLLHSVIALYGRGAESLSTDFSRGDKVINFLATRDIQWADENIAGTIHSYNTNHVLVFDSVMKLVYSYSDSLQEEVRLSFPPGEKLADVLSEDSSLHFFLKTTTGLFEFFGSPVWSHRNQESESKPAGWIFAGKTWVAESLEEIAAMTSSVLTLDTATVVTDYSTIGKEKVADVHAVVVLQGWSGRPVGVLNSTASFPFLNEYKHGFNRFLFITIAFVLLLLVVLSLLFSRFVELPLTYLNKALEFRDIKYIKPLKNYKTEFGKLSLSVQSIFEKESLLIETDKRRVIENELSKSEHRFRLLVENNPDILWIADSKGDAIYFSPNLTTVTGYATEDIVGNEEFWQEFIHPDDYLTMLNHYDDFIKNNTHYEVEYRMKRKDGDYMWIEEKAIANFEQDGVTYYCGRLSDITQQKLNEQRLFESAEEFRVLFEQNPFGVAVIDLIDYKLERVNQALCDMLGYEPGELNKLNLSDITPAEDLKLEMEASVNARKLGLDIFSVVKRLYKKNGELIWVNLTITYLKDKQGKRIFGCGVVENITEKKRIQDSFNKEHKLLVSLMENVPDLIFFKDKDGRYINVNQATVFMMERLGSPDPLDKNHHELLAGQPYFQEIIDEEMKIFQSGIPLINKEVRLDSKDGQTFWFSATKIPLSFSGEGVDVLVCILRDITERKENEIKLRQYARELKENILSKDKFLSVLAHDLKNPFNAILGFSSVLLEEYDDYSDDQRRHFIRNIHKAADNTFSLIQNILEWSRAQTGRIAFNPEYLDLSAVINETIKLHKPVLDSKGITVEGTVADGTRVFADENMVNTVLRNLVSNAMKFSHPGGSIRIASRVLHHGMIEVFVEDEGIGIPEDALVKLFRIDDSYRREGTRGEQGTGLGLILCKEFIERNGGMIWASSDGEKGSVFHFTIPAEPAGMKHSSEQEVV